MNKYLKIIVSISLIFFFSQIVSTQLCFSQKKDNKCIFNHPAKGQKCTHTYNLPSSAVKPTFYSHNKELIDKLDKLLLSNEPLILKVTIHSCVRGAQAFNFKTTEIVKQALYEHFINDTKIDTSRIKIITVGEKYPLIANEKILKEKNLKKAGTLDDKNRRFDFEIIGFRMEFRNK